MKKVLITGGNGDIALAIINKLKEIGRFDIYAPSKIELDVTDESRVRFYINSIKPDILINNAGYIKPQSIFSSQLESDLLTIDVNLKGVFNCTNAVLLNNKDAFVINIGSSAGTKKRADWGAYCATKAAVIMATKCWAEEGVKVVCISPGRTNTKMRRSLFSFEDNDTLLKAQDFAVIIIMAIQGKFCYGDNIDVNIKNIHGLLK